MTPRPAAGPAVRAGTALVPLALSVGVVLLDLPVAARALFLVAAPALALAVPVRRLDPLARGLLALAVAVVIDVLVAEVMLSAGVWSIAGGTVSVGCLSSALWLGLEYHRNGASAVPA